MRKGNHAQAARRKEWKKEKKGASLFIDTATFSIGQQ